MYSSLFAAPFPGVAKCTFSIGRFDCYQDINYNSNWSPCWTNFTREFKNRIASVPRGGVWICSFLSGKQVGFSKSLCMSSCDFCLLIPVWIYAL